MKKILLPILLCIANGYAFAQAQEPIIKKSAAKISDFMPRNWKLIAEAKGDLNKDGLVDIAIVIENTDPKNLINNRDNFGGGTLNINPRYLLVVFKRKDGPYELVAKNTSFIPSRNSQQSPCLSDPFGDVGRISIEKGLLKVYLQNFYSCGAWEIYNFEYIFRYQNQKLELIGYNESSLHRSSGEQTIKTINFSTFKMDYTIGLNAFKDDQKSKTTWKSIKPRKRLDLNSITEESVDLFNY